MSVKTGCKAGLKNRYAGAKIYGSPHRVVTGLFTITLTDALNDCFHKRLAPEMGLMLKFCMLFLMS